MEHRELQVTDMENILISGEERKSGGAGTRARARDRNCPFTRGECDGGIVHEDGNVGCAFKEAPDAECAWMAELPEGMSPRDFYNEKVLEAIS